jgi:hypothetical protein
MFSLAGDIEAIAQERRELYAPVYAAIPDAAAAATILSTKMRAVRDVRVDLNGDVREVRRGELLEPTDRLVAFDPESFEQVTVEG